MAAGNRRGKPTVEKARLAGACRKVAERLPHRAPVSTYRLQFNSGFRFADAEAVSAYLNALGVTDIYSSPYFKAKEGSTHGYDVIDYQSINPEIGAEVDFVRFTAELGRLDMGLIMDIVPNHMSIAGGRNAWWRDVLENGPSSPFAPFFDIDWNPVREVLEDKVILPILGDFYGKVLENREISLSFEEGAFFIRYYEHRLPVDPSTYERILTHRGETFEEALGGEDPRFQEYLSIVTALKHLPTRTERDPDKATERLREKEVIKRRIWTLYDECPKFGLFVEENVRILNGTNGDIDSFDLLDELLASQVYRLTFWQVATEEINYRRFFDINDLAAVRNEDPEVFRESHGMVLGHVREGKITGMRADHPDGLHNPGEYFMRLQEECFIRLVEAELGLNGSEDAPAGEIRKAYRGLLEENPALSRPFYVVGEKILMESERMPEDWPVSGTTGYVFMNSANALFVNHANARLMTDIYHRFIRSKPHYPDLVYKKKKLIMQTSMASEINVLGHRLNRISESDRHFRDFTLNSLINAIVEVIALFPVYRTYADESGVNDRDVRYIEAAVSRARRRRRDLSASVFDFLRDVLTLGYPEKFSEAECREWLDFAMKFQQLTGPVMAKGLEDTVFYSFNRLASLNEVGGNPDRFGISPEAFHGQNIETAKHWPHTMVATSTHDSKRSEDVRARINVLSELPYHWRERLARWRSLNKRRKSKIEGRLAPGQNDEYLIYQTLLGAWPLGPLEGQKRETFIERVRQYAVKAAREAKANTTWINPDAEYENALIKFIDGIMASSDFIEDLLPFQKLLAHYGMFNSLSQTLLKITSPGVPDFYQGTELWTLTLVDPDNRRPVDYSLARRMLEELREREAGGEPLELARDLLENKEDGRIKLYLTFKALNFRKEKKELFLSGDYAPLYAAGEQARRAVAFERGAQGASAITVVPRLVSGIISGEEDPVGDVWRGTFLLLPPDKEGALYRDVFTGRTLRAGAHEGRAALELSEVFAGFPVALLEETG